MRDLDDCVAVPAKDLLTGSQVMGAHGWLTVDRITQLHEKDGCLFRLHVGGGIRPLTVSGQHRIIVELSRPSKWKRAETLQPGDVVCVWSEGQTMQVPLRRVEKFPADAVVVQICFKPDEPVCACDPPPPRSSLLSKGHRPNRRGGGGQRQIPSAEVMSIPDTEDSWL